MNATRLAFSSTHVTEAPLPVRTLLMRPDLKSGLQDSVRALREDRTDEDAWRRFADAIWPLVVHLTAGRKLDVDPASIHQEVLARIYTLKTLPQWSTTVAVRSYVKRTIACVCHELGRDPRFESLATASSRTLAPEENAVVQEAIDSMAEQLSASEYELMRLILQGWSKEEIAESLELNSGSLVVRIYRLREKLTGVASRSMRET